MASSFLKPTREMIAGAYGKKVPDVIGPRLTILFCGINPGLYSGAVGHHFARPGNRFWPTLHSAGFSARLLSPFEERELLLQGYGITNLVDRATAAADEISPEELREGAGRLAKKVRRYQPVIIAFLGITAYRMAFDRKQAVLGRQPERLGQTEIWVLPNPSGLNAHYQLGDLVQIFKDLRKAAGQ